MRVTSNQIIIDDPRLVELFQKKQSSKFFRACEDVLILMGELPETVETIPEDRIMRRLGEITSDIISAIPSVKLDLSQVVSEVKSATETLGQKVDSFSHIRTTNSFKGKEGEDIVLGVLKQNFNQADGYTIENTTSGTNCCDFVLKKVTFTDVRIESKAYTGDVNRAQVDKFISDLIKSNNHGVMVSVFTGVAKKKSIDIQLVPTTNKLAFFVSGTDNLADIVRLIHRLDHMTTRIDGDETMTSLTPESVVKIREHIKDFSKKRDEIITHMDHSVKLLKSMAFDVIEKIVFLEPLDKKVRCMWCDKQYSGAKCLSKHMDTCKKKPKDAVEK